VLAQIYLCGWLCSSYHARCYTSALLYLYLYLTICIMTGAVWCCDREKSKKWSEQMAALVCLRALGTASSSLSCVSHQSADCTSHVTCVATRQTSSDSVQAEQTLSSCADLTVASLCPSSSSSSSSSSSVSQLSPGCCDCSSSSTMSLEHETLAHKRIKLSPPTNTTTSNQVTDDDVSSAVEV